MKKLIGSVSVVVLLLCAGAGYAGEAKSTEQDKASYDFVLFLESAKGEKAYIPANLEVIRELGTRWEFKGEPVKVASAITAGALSGMIVRHMDDRIEVALSGPECGQIAESFENIPVGETRSVISAGGKCSLTVVAN